MGRGTNCNGVQVEDLKVCVVMVGLPARGKSYIAQKGTAALAVLVSPVRAVADMRGPC